MFNSYYMGVPGFFAWLLKKYKSNNIITNSINDSIDILYIDANCLFHPQCYKVLNYYIDKGKKIELEKLELKMISRILNYIDYLIGFANPKKAVFISVDGVAPCAKISQQRKRRYKAIYDNELRNELKKKHNRSNSDIWNNTTITPGTKFMEKLHQHLLKYIKENRIGLNIDYIYSSYHTNGEGEHKILQDIKERSKDSKNKEEVYSIYGLDADLIFLSLASGKDKIYLLREEIFLKNGTIEQDKEEIIDILKDVGENLNYVSIDETRECINLQFRSLIYDVIGDEYYYSNYEKMEFVNDFIVLCYFLGNDFIPNIPSIDIKNDGLDFLLNLYIDTYLTLENGIIDDSLNLNTIFFELYLENISKHEDYYFKIKYPKYIENIKRRKCLSVDNYDKDLWDIENTKIFEINDPIKLGNGDAEIWKFKYYEHYFGVSQSQEEHTNKMCEEFIKGIKWTSLYYFDKCPSWNWYYSYSHAPFASDIFNFLKHKKFTIDHITFNTSITLTPFIQLLSVLPPKCYDLLPPKYGGLMISKISPIIDMFPETIVIDMLYKDSYHKCIPLIPNININRIMNTIKNIELTSEEKTRNIILDNFIVSSKENKVI